MTVQRRGPIERLTERARLVLILANDEARAMGVSYVATEHLLLGLLREEEGLAARILDECGITDEDVRLMARRILSGAS